MLSAMCNMTDFSRVEPTENMRPFCSSIDLASVHSLVVADDNHVERVDEFVDAAADCRSQLTSLLDGNRVRL